MKRIEKRKKKKKATPNNISIYIKKNRPKYIVLYMNSKEL